MGRLRNTVESDQGDPGLAQYFTPAPVAEFMWKVVQLYADGALGPGARIIDPAAGRGDILDAVLAQRSVSAGGVYGIEVDPSLADQRVGQTNKARFYTGDGLLDRFPGVIPGSFEVVIGNPPFGRLGKILPYKAGEDRWNSFEIWRAGAKNKSGLSSGQEGRSIAIDQLFIERALSLVRPEGLIALILPEGFFANQRLQAARDWVLERAAVLGVVALPENAFCRPGLHARTSTVFLRKISAGKRGHDSVVLDGDTGESSGMSLQSFLAKTLENLRRAHRGGEGTSCIRVPARQLKGERWDVRFWQGRKRVLRLDPRLPLVRLGDYIEHLTYGPIVTGGHPQHVEDGIQVIRQGDFAETGLYLKQALSVSENSVYDPSRSRVRKGDLLLPRSGAGVLGKNRLAVYTGEKPANIGCFVDLIRLRGLNAFYAWFFLKTQPGWNQIRSIINGVGTPNINFSEIRSLRLPPIPPEEQKHLEIRYLKEVWPLHCRREESPGIRFRAGECFRCIVHDLERFLEGGDRSLGR